MEVGDPFVPAFPSDDDMHVEVPEQWLNPFGNGNAPSAEAAPAEESEPVSDAAPAPEPEPAPAPAPSFDTFSFNPAGSGDGLDRARTLADQLAQSLQSLQSALHDGDTERGRLLADADQMRARISALEVEAAHKEQLKRAITEGPGSALTQEDLQAMHAMADALVQDPDRLTILFQVVQQAGKLATVLTVYSELRRMAAEL